jgi:hypothetical protein
MLEALRIEEKESEMLRRRKSMNTGDDVLHSQPHAFSRV